jgi:RNA polymerase sigma-70 factor (ECF subfamily)
MSLEMEDLADLYRRYGLLIERRCMRVLGSAADARDAAHETFARAAAKLETFRGESERLAWLYRISTNVSLNVLRERRMRGDDWKQAVKQSIDAATTDEERTAAERQCIRRVIDSLGDATMRALVVHVYFDDMSQGEAAELLGISRATANTKLSDFRTQARRLLEVAS